MKISPLAPARFPKLPVVDGVRFAAVEAGVRYTGRKDVMMAVLSPGSTVAGVFTKSATRAAPVLDCEAKIKSHSDDGAVFLVNAGNANAFTGSKGRKSVEAITQAVSDIVGLPAKRVFTSSTGVIGEPLAHDRIIDKLTELEAALSPDAIADAADAIRTTDTFSKGASEELLIDGKIIKIVGIAKGSGMIAPDMATMLVYIFTDAKIPQGDLGRMVRDVSDKTFNRITVDGDTSTSDTVLMGATGTSGVEVNCSSEAFRAALYDVMLDLAQQVVKDGEGATKFVEVRVKSAETEEDAKKVAFSIANSPLVKTAVAGEDPNWGRVVMAVGKSGANANRDRLSISFGDICVAENGWVSPDYKEEEGAAYMKRDHLVICVDLGMGQCSDTVWTCDLTHGYIEINADYRS